MLYVAVIAITPAIIIAPVHAVGSPGHSSRSTKRAHTPTPVGRHPGHHAACYALWADAYTEIAQYGRTHEAWLKSFLDVPNGIPSHDTFERVLGRLDRHAFERCFAEWASAVAVLATGEVVPQVVAIDGKTARRSRDASSRDASGPNGSPHNGSITNGPCTKALHTVSAWARRQQLMLGQVRTEEKSNEITAIRSRAYRCAHRSRGLDGSTEHRLRCLRARCSPDRVQE